MRVVMLLGRSTGGIGTHVAQLSADLRVQGADVTVVTDSLTASRFDLGDVRRWWPRLGDPAVLWQSFRGVRATRRLAAGADVVHAHGHQAGLLAAVVTLGLRSRDLGTSGPRAGSLPAGGPRLVVSHHNAVLAGSGRLALKALAQRWVARRADLVTGASSDLVAQAEAAGARRARLAPVPSPKVPGLLSQAPGIPAERAIERALLLNDAGALPLVLTVSRIAPQKDLPVLVQAAALLTHPCLWVVVGDGEEELRRSLVTQVGRLGAQVRFVGARPDVQRWLRAAEVFVLPSRWEARALVVQEAMAAGTPVVASDVGGLTDLVDGVGVLVPVGDPAAVAAAVDAVLAEPARREQLSRHGREFAAGLPDGPDTAAQWLAWYVASDPMT